MLSLHINGQPRTLDLDPPVTLASVLDHLAIQADRVAVELNTTIAPRTSWPVTQVAEGDKLEIVHFVGGGSPSRHDQAPAVPADR